MLDLCILGYRSKFLLLSLAEYTRVGFCILIPVFAFTAHHINTILSMATGKKHKISQLQIHPDADTKHIHKGIKDSYYMGKNGKVCFFVFCEIDCVTRVVKEVSMLSVSMYVTLIKSDDCRYSTYNSLSRFAKPLQS